MSRKLFDPGETLKVGQETGYAIKAGGCVGCMFDAPQECRARPTLLRESRSCGGVIFVAPETFALMRLKGEV